MKKSDTLFFFPPTTSQSSASALHLFWNHHTHHPQSVPIMPCCLHARGLCLRHAIIVPPYLTHSYANIRFHPNIWWQEFPVAFSVSPWLCRDRLAWSGIDYWRVKVISHILYSQPCKTHHCLFFFYCRHVLLFVHMDSWRQMGNSFLIPPVWLLCYW